MRVRFPLGVLMVKVRCHGWTQNHNLNVIEPDIPIFDLVEINLDQGCPKECNPCPLKSDKILCSGINEDGGSQSAWHVYIAEKTENGVKCSAPFSEGCSACWLRTRK